MRLLPGISNKASTRHVTRCLRKLVIAQIHCLCKRLIRRYMKLLKITHICIMSYV